MDGHFQRDTFPLVRQTITLNFPLLQVSAQATSPLSRRACTSSPQVTPAPAPLPFPSPLSHSYDCEPPATYEQGRSHLGWRSRSPRTSRSACPSPRSECPSFCTTSSASGTCGPGLTSPSPW